MMNSTYEEGCGDGAIGISLCGYYAYIYVYIYILNQFDNAERLPQEAVMAQKHIWICILICMGIST